MTKQKFDTNEDYWRWFEAQEEKRIIKEYFKEDEDGSKRLDN